MEPVNIRQEQAFEQIRQVINRVRAETATKEDLDAVQHIIAAELMYISGYKMLINRGRIDWSIREDSRPASQSMPKMARVLYDYSTMRQVEAERIKHDDGQSDEDRTYNQGVADTCRVFLMLMRDFPLALESIGISKGE